MATRVEAQLRHVHNDGGELKVLQELWRYLLERSSYELARDLLDILITYYIFYRAALVLRGTRAMQVVFGLALVVVLYVFAQQLRLQTVLTLLSAVLSSAILIAVILFQNDIRRGLMRVGARARIGSGLTLEGRVIEQVVEAAVTLARHRTGAIITFEQEANIDEFVGSNSGQTLDAAVNADLLVSLFIPEAMNKLHDGAVIIRDLRIAKAGVFFPMPDTRVVDNSFGSRHRAALGITEETDAVVVVVSEERGSISFCFNGNIVPNLDGPRLKAALEGVFVPKKAARVRSRAPQPAAPIWQQWFRKSVPPPPEPRTVPLVPVRKTESRPAEEAAPLRKKRELGPDEAPKPLRKKKKVVDHDEKLDSQRQPEPLRKRNSRDSVELGRAADLLRAEDATKERPADAVVRTPSHPPPPIVPIPQADTVKTPLRHLAPALMPEADLAGPDSRRPEVKPTETRQPDSIRPEPKPTDARATESSELSTKRVNLGASSDTPAEGSVISGRGGQNGL